MKVIFIHGPPAVGKLTIARALASQIPARLTDNHASIDLARTVIDFGAPGFWDLIHKLRLDLLEAAAIAQVPHFITTACYHTGDTGIIADWEAVMRRHKATFLPVHLICDPDIQATRVTRPDRAERRKLTSVSGLEGYMAKNDYAPLQRDNCLILDTSHTPPQDIATQIIDAFDLGRLPA